MKGNWFRCYEDTLENPKVQKLPDHLFKIWFNLLCLASKNGGSLPDIERIAFALRTDETAIETALETLIETRLFDRCNGEIVPHNWEERQYVTKKSGAKTSTERVKEYRKRKRLAAQNEATGKVDETHETQSETVSPPSETLPDSDSDTETDSEIKESPSYLPTVSREPDEVEEAVRRYNVVAKDLGGVTAQKISSQRRSSLKRRLRDCGGLDGWDTALAKARASPFLRGEVNDFRLSIDFLLQESSFTKLMEGFYDGRRKDRAADQGGNALKRARENSLFGSDPEEVH